MVEPCQNQESKTPSILHSAVPQEAEADAEVGVSELSIWIGDIGASHNAHYAKHPSTIREDFYMLSSRRFSVSFNIWAYDSSLDNYCAGCQVQDQYFWQVYIQLS